MQAEVKNQIDAWKTYDSLIGDPRVMFCPEPDSDAIEDEFRALTTGSRFASQQWQDAYLAAFAKSCNLILVTLDGALSKLASGALLLR